jgi:predicted lipid-binding transport protein (Tim44 family)
MRRVGCVLAASVLAVGAAAAVLAPTDAWSRAGDGGSFGSRGSFTFSPPAATRTAPYSAQPMQRSYTPAPSYARPSYGQPAYANRSPFMSGLMGGLIGAGIGGLLFGHGLFGGITGIGSFLGFLVQIFLLVLLGRFLIGLFLRRQPAFAGMSAFARTGAPTMAAGGSGGRPAVQPLEIRPQDFQAFEVVLKNIQAAWTAHDMNALRRMATPEMASYFAEQLADQTSRGVRNLVTDVRLEQGDLAEAWHEQGRDYATVAMRFSMLDVTRDGRGRVVQGSDTVRSLATELWTFVRVPGGVWLLSAIQQAR